MKKPNHFFESLLSRLIKERDRDAFLSDIEEIYLDIAEKRGISAANIWYFSQLLKSILPAIINNLGWSLIMLNNTLKIFFRNLRRHKGYMFINIFGLAAGITCCFLILLYVQHEFSYDKFFKNGSRIYRVIREYGTSGSVGFSANSSYPIAPALKTDFPEVIDAVRFQKRFRPVIRYEDKQFWEERFCVVDSTFFNLFSFPLVRGNPATLLREPHSVVITEETARRYFGETDPMGKVLLYNHDTEFNVTGVLSDLPENSHFKFDFIASIESLSGPWEKWTTFVSNYTYILLQEDYDPAALEKKLPGFIDKHVGEELAARGYTFNLHLQKLTDIHLHSQLSSEIKPNGNITTVTLLVTIALLILLIACINFMNLTTARSAQRAKEVGLRKVIGAHRFQLVKQFLSESIIQSLIALLIAIGLVQLFLPTFNTVLGIKLDFHQIDTLSLIGMAGIILFVGVAAGGYPAFFLSAFRPAEVLKGRSKTGPAGSRVRQSFVLFQFVISIILIICSGIVYDQMKYVMDKDLGFSKEQILVVHMGSQVGARSEVLKKVWKQNPNVVNAAASLLIPSKDLWTWNVIPEGSQSGISTGTFMVDYDFIDTYQMEIIAGRGFSKEMLTEATDGFLINEEAMKQFGWDSPPAALDKKLDWASRRKGRVIGVVKDFHVLSMHEKIDPVLFMINPEYYYLSARIRTEDMANTLVFLGKSWSEYLSHLPFEYFFVNDRFDQLHRADRKIGTIFGYFAAIAIAIACLGLFGLVSFTAQQRIKEIGIRKGVGATESNIIFLLCKAFLKPVFFANIIAWPLAYFAMNY